MEQYISICPVCGHVYAHSNVKTIPCGSCGKSKTVYSGFTAEMWNQQTKQKQKDVVEEVRAIGPVDMNEDIAIEQNVAGSASDAEAGKVVYKNPGKSIRSIATVCCLASIVLDILISIGVYNLIENELLLIVVFAILCLMSWLSYLLLAGFGELVENSTKIVKLLEKKN